MKYYMAHYDNRFWILWIIGAIMALSVCLCSSWSEDTLLLAVAFVMSLIAIAIIHKLKNRTTLYNILFWLGYNALLNVYSLNGCIKPLKI